VAHTHNECPLQDLGPGTRTQPTRCQSGLSTAVDHSPEQSSGHRCKLLMRVVIISVKQMKTYVAATAERPHHHQHHHHHWQQWPASILISNELWAQRMWVVRDKTSLWQLIHIRIPIAHRPPAMATTMKVNKILQEWTHHRNGHRINKLMSNQASWLNLYGQLLRNFWQMAGLINNTFRPYDTDLAFD